MSTLSLDGPEWRVAQAYSHPPEAGEVERITNWYPAVVPGDVRLDLQRAGEIPADLYYGEHSLRSAWVENFDWWYTRDVALDLRPGQRAFLVLRGVDYVSWVYFNGHMLGYHEGMFSPQVYEITGRAAAHNRLAVYLLGAAHLPRRTNRRESLLDRIETVMQGPVFAMTYRRQVVKSQMGFGWDFAPAMRTMGLWDDTFVRVTGSVAVHDAYARPVLQDDGRAWFDLSFTADALAGTRARLSVELCPATWPGEPQHFTFDLLLKAGSQRVAVRLPVNDPRLWWPWDRGRPDLYDLTLALSAEGDGGGGGSGQPSDTWHERVGLRDVHMARNEGAPPEAAPWTFVVNGRRLFARGANWVPADAFPARVTPDDYHALLGMALDANMNMLRVWGGGVREKHAFYAEADRLGLLLWHEFPHSCAFTARFPRSSEYLQLAEREAAAIVRTLRNHPSVVMWCGGNEFSPQRNARLVAGLRRAVQEEDGARPFNPASPSGGESHNWTVWHQQAPVAVYREDAALFASEFGMQAVPDVESLRKFIPPGELWPPGPSWLHHNAELAKLSFYARPYLDHAPGEERRYQSEWTRNFRSAEEFASATQRAQADGLQVAIEHFRRRKGACGGCLLWQLNAPWPAVSWAIVDYYRRPTRAYERIKRIYNPLLVSLDFPIRQYAPGERVEADVWLINDWPRGFEGCRVEVSLGPREGPSARWNAEASIPADSAQRAGHVSLVLPGRNPDAWALVARIWQGETLLSENGYQLDTHDWRRLPLLNRLQAYWVKRMLE